MRYRDHRYAADTRVRLACDYDVHDAELVNISATGLRIQHPELLPAGTLVTICYLHVRAPARVIRSNGEETALRFVLPLSASDLNAIRGSKGSHSGNWGAVTYQGLRELS
jgi:hypothetical protein